MNVREILDQLEKCNEEATVSSIMQSEKDESFYFTVVLRTERENDLVDIVVMDIRDEGITVKELKNELELYEDHFPVFIKENRLRPIRFPYEVVGVENNNDTVLLRLPHLMGNLYER